MTRVKMKCEALGEVREFDIDHAEQLLAYQAKYQLKDWELDDHNFTVKNGIIERANTGASKVTRKQTGDSESN